MLCDLLHMGHSFTHTSNTNYLKTFVNFFWDDGILIWTYCLYQIHLCIVLLGRYIFHLTNSLIFVYLLTGCLATTKKGHWKIKRATTLCNSQELGHQTGLDDSNITFIQITPIWMMWWLKVGLVHVNSHKLTCIIKYVP